MNRARIRAVLIALAALLVLSALALGGYGAKGYFDALADAPALAERADRLIAAGRGPEGLGDGRFETLLRIEDPGFLDHDGVDMASRGAGMTTLTQSLAKRLAFENFRPGLGKIRQTAYALGLEQRLTKDQIAALALDTAQMGRGPDGWMVGFYTASEAIYGMPPAQLDETRFLRLVAVLIAPRRFELRGPDPALDDRVDRIERMIEGDCRPADVHDVWLEGCA